VDRLARDEAPIVTDQEQAGGGDLVDVPLAAQRDSGLSRRVSMLPGDTM